ncbi:Carbonyl reductase [NADPH] 1 [Galdieria sulphuraria]|uniref:Carbonyl reductase (NADPH) n=1 Tax=Galdieria sulphuraria TaxID=130081 RepID=M2Y3B9_GALSU|nr:carbonyl reductase (NADPH) [Galdieria sulphuraria]EME30314.1 carbonyl reductase (NADPH) [Galdieria sulphuraria]GJD08478.1 Carbonyl reductase [NADPH] 1 [Galdieria sulphuraria]|eukprot:XP_005706834.1 carbonyl reductase (NADPH) [Galdieria sulphuraria]
MNGLVSQVSALNGTSNKRIALVTGGNKGIGFEICRLLGNPQNNILVILGARDKQRGNEACKKLEQQGIEVVFRELEVSDITSVKNCAAWVQDTFGHLDILVNNAGIFYKTGPLSKEVARHTMDVNFYGTLYCCQYFIPLLREGGRVVNMSSRMALFARLSPALFKKFTKQDLNISELCELMESFIRSVEKGRVKEDGWFRHSYGVSKVGVVCLTRILARDERRPDILINCCCPGFVRTDMTAPNAEKTPEEGADTPVWLALLPKGGPTGKFFGERKELDIRVNFPAPRLQLSKM